MVEEAPTPSVSFSFLFSTSRGSMEVSTAPKHTLGVDLLKLILRAKDPFPPKFYCHSCKKKFIVPMNSTSSRTTKCTMCPSEFIEWVLPEDPHKRASRLRDAALMAEFQASPSPSPPPSPSPSPPPPAAHDQEAEKMVEAEKKEEEEPEKKEEGEPEKKEEEEPMETESSSASAQTTSEDKPAETETSGNGEKPEPTPEPMEEEAAKKEEPPPPEDEEPEEEEEEEERSSGGRLSAQPMVVVSAGGDREHPTLTMNLFPSLNEAGPRNEGRRGPIRTTIVQQRKARNFTYHAQEYMAKVIGGRDRNGQPRRGQQLLVGLTGGAQTEKSDPADFVWGARGLDSIISGLLESMSDRGPPPAKKDKVDAIPTVDATQEVVDENVDGCTVCKDLFKVGDKLRRLPCKHLFHESCIIPWLKLHDTCPTCRYHVNTDKKKASKEEEEEEEEEDEDMI